ncbi:MAG: hypothetical protein ACI4UF_08035 [Thermoguttaceae bacterium]
MYYLIGTDEAGYGPNLGPLAVTATLWRVEDDALAPETLFDALRPVVVTSPGRGKGLEIPITDSKKLHRHETLEPLERGIFASLYALGLVTDEPVETAPLCDLICGPELAQERRSVVWHTPQTEEKLPRDLPRDRVAELGSALREAMEKNGVRLCGIRSELVFPRRFNDGVEAVDSKGVFLSDTTLILIVRFWNELLQNVQEKAEVRVFCDKHGGRNFYLPALMDFFPALPFCVVEEGRAASEYVHYGERIDLRIRFQAKGEALLPVALASMVSKYLREISMDRFNAWWLAQIPGLTPTAGYPLDAKRFREEISEKMQELKIDWREMWRNR